MDRMKIRKFQPGAITNPHSLRKTPVPTKIIFCTLFMIAFAHAAFPQGFDPAPWTPPTDQGFTGDYAANNALASIQKHGESEVIAPEDIAIDKNGNIYACSADGRIVRWQPDFSQPQTFVNTGGRPLGLHFDTVGNLIVADANRGLLAIDRESNMTVLSTQHEGRPYRLLENVEIAQDGTIYFTDASHKFTKKNLVDDLFEHQANGRLLAYDPTSKTTRLILGNIYFANGVALDAKEKSLFVVETGMYRILRHWIEGPKKGKTEVVRDNLPGYPDGLSVGSNDVLWVAIGSPRNESFDAMMPKPFHRKIVHKLPKFLHPAPIRYSFILGLNQDGSVQHNLQDPQGNYAVISRVIEHQGNLYMGSFLENAVGVIPAP
jgi:sugar lactone lactonase YvrE